MNTTFELDELRGLAPQITSRYITLSDRDGLNVRLHGRPATEVALLQVERPGAWGGNVCVRGDGRQNTGNGQHSGEQQLRDTDHGILTFVGGGQYAPGV